MSEFERKDLQILELLFYKESVGFSAILEETKISRSSLARHLRYLKKEGYILKNPDEKKRFFIYELAQEGDRLIIPVLLEKNHIITEVKLDSAAEIEDLKVILLEKRERDLIQKRGHEQAIRNAKLAREDPETPKP